MMIQQMIADLRLTTVRARALSSKIRRTKALGLDLFQLHAFDLSTSEGRAKERHRRVAFSALASAVAKTVSIAAALASVPLTLHYLGPERYGMWMAMSSLIAMLSFADLGMGNGLLNAVAHANGNNDRASIGMVVSSALFVLTTISLLLAAVATILYPVIPWHRLFNVHSAVAMQEAGPAVAVLLTCFLLAIPLGVVQKTQTGLQQGFATGLWQCAASLLGLGCVLLAIHLQYGLPWLVAALVGAPLAAGVSNAVIFFGIQARDIAPRAVLISRRAMTGIARTGILFLVLQIVGAIAFSADNIIIVQMLGPSSVAQYAVPAQIFNLVTTVVSMGLSPLWPAYGTALAQGDYAWVRRTLVCSILISVAVATLGSTVLVVFGGAILNVWVGRTIEAPLPLMLGLGMWKIIEAGGIATTMFLNGANNVRLQAGLATLMAFAAILLKIWFVSWIGIAGAIWATILAYLIFVALPLSFALPRIVSYYGRGAQA
jgi:O-antigen/teichoic acid export membrane protein